MDTASIVHTCVSASSAGIDLIAAFYGCLYAGCVPITVRPPHPQNISTTLPTVKMIVEVRLLICLLNRCGFSFSQTSRAQALAPS